MFGRTDVLAKNNDDSFQRLELVRSKKHENPKKPGHPETKLGTGLIEFETRRISGCLNRSFAQIRAENILIGTCLCLGIQSAILPSHKDQPETEPILFEAIISNQNQSNMDRQNTTRRASKAC